MHVAARTIVTRRKEADSTYAYASDARIYHKAGLTPDSTNYATN